jgi:site-specific DNA-methyltransferase (adenine-specific)
MIQMPTESNPVVVVEGDCLEMVPSLRAAGVDAVVSDPPYGMDWNTDCSRFSGGAPETVKKRGNGGCVRESVIGDRSPFDPSPWIPFPKVLLFGANHFAANLPVGTTLVWLKRNDDAFGSFLSDAEVAWMKGGHGVYCHRDLSMKAIAREQCHPCQKPVGLMRWCIRRLKLPPGSLILDPFSGSGTTGVAAIKEGMRAILIEREPTYAAIARRRVAEAMGTGLLAGLS